MVEIDFYRKPFYISSFSKHLKHHQTPAEQILRDKIRAKRFHGLKFHRQKPLFTYREHSGVDRFFIADFYYHPCKLYSTAKKPVKRSFFGGLSYTDDF